MLIALGDAGAAEVFDCFCGTSSGSINLSYFLTGANWDALSVYYDFLAGGAFFSPRRLLRGHPPVDLNYLFDEVMAHRVPLDYQALARLPDGLLNVTATSVDDVAPTIISSFRSADEAYHVLKAGSWLPLLSGRPYVMDGHRYLDSGVLYPDPALAALDIGCTHVLVCNTRPQTQGPNHSVFQRRLLQRLLNHWQPTLGDEYFDRRMQWHLSGASEGYGDISLRGVCVYRLAPPAGGHLVSRLTTDRASLLDGARAGYAAMLDALGIGHSELRFSLVDVHQSTSDAPAA
jgi:predicted patatin/cPLA2 family phospholipase